MELARIILKLSGDVKNTVLKKDVTPAQLAVYAFMHGEDCVQTLDVTGYDDKRPVHVEMDRLRAEFQSKHAIEAVNTLFPGRFPHLPSTFRAVGFDPDELGDNSMPRVVTPQAANQSEAAILAKIRGAAEQRKAEKNQNVPPVDPVKRADLLDNTGDPEDDDDDNEDPDSIGIPNDPLSEEIRNSRQSGGNAPPPPPNQE